MTPFKQLLSFLLVGLLTIGCEKDKSNISPAGENQPLIVRVNQPLRVGSSISLSIDKIQDSRCPANMVCIWAGNVGVSFTLKSENQSKSGELCLGQCGQTGSVTVVELRGASYEITLSEVRPYPGTDSSGNPQEVVLYVKEKK